MRVHREDSICAGAEPVEVGKSCEALIGSSICVHTANHGVTVFPGPFSVRMVARKDRRRSVCRFDQPPTNCSTASMNVANAGSSAWRIWLLPGRATSLLPGTIAFNSSASSNDQILSSVV